MSYESYMAYHRQVIVTVCNNTIKAFISKEDADYYYMNNDAMQEERCNNVIECIEKAENDASTLFWTETYIGDITWYIYSLSKVGNFAKYSNLETALSQVVMAIIDDEIRQAKEGKI